MDEELKTLLGSTGEHLCGYHMESIVGIRYAKGASLVGYGTWMVLQREPSNHYDPFAVRVDLLDGVKVGYIRAVYARKLSKVMDDVELMKKIYVKCVALDSRDEYDVKTLVVFYRREEEEDEEIQSALRNHLEHKITLQEIN